MPFRWSELKFTDGEPNYPLQGRAVAILGGGPSLTHKVANAVQVGPTIAVNNSYILLKRSGLVVALDKRWYGWHGEHLAALGHRCVAAARPGWTDAGGGLDLHLMEKDRTGILPPDRRTLCGMNSGHAAITFAYLCGATRIYLAGFDMGFPDGKTHWHSGHDIPSSQPNYEKRFRPALEDLSKKALQNGVLVAAITSTAANIPRASLDAALEDLTRDQNCVDHPPPSASL